MIANRGFLTSAAVNPRRWRWHSPCCNGRSVRRALLASLLLFAACGDDEGGSAPDAGLPDAGPVTQGSEAASDLALNEVDPDGDPDWFELVNRSDSAIDLCDYFATDSLDRLDHYVALGGAAPPDACEPALLDAGDYLVVTPEIFGLGDADEVHIARWADGAAVDGLLYLDVAHDGQTLARSPDGEGLFVASDPTPGEPNP